MKIKTSKIKHILKSKGRDINWLKTRMGLVSRQAAEYRIKSAKSLRTIEAIAKALGVKVNDIL
jgi:hypothetical protein